MNIQEFFINIELASICPSTAKKHFKSGIPGGFLFFSFIIGSFLVDIWEMG
jgi:hypothetical protein